MDSCPRRSGVRDGATERRRASRDVPVRSPLTAGIRARARALMPVIGLRDRSETTLPCPPRRLFYCPPVAIKVAPRRDPCAANEPVTSRSFASYLVAHFAGISLPG